VRGDGRSQLGRTTYTPESAVPLLVRFERQEQLFAAKVWPECRGRVILGVRRLPDEKVAEAHFAASADNQVGIGLAGSVEVIGQDLLGHGLRGYALGEDRSHGVDDLRATTVVEGDVQDDPLIVSGQFDRLGDRTAEILRKTGDPTDMPQADAVAV